MGDFNFDPRSDAEQSRLGRNYVDLWRALASGHGVGHTVDSSQNRMRFLHKGKHKHVRFDRILLRSVTPGWAPRSIRLLGTEPLSPATPNTYPSDHFNREHADQGAPADAAPLQRSGRRRQVGAADRDRAPERAIAPTRIFGLVGLVQPALLAPLLVPMAIMTLLTALPALPLWFRRGWAGDDSRVRIDNPLALGSILRFGLRSRRCAGCGATARCRFSYRGTAEGGK